MINVLRLRKGRVCLYLTQRQALGSLSISTHVILCLYSSAPSALRLAFSRGDVYFCKQCDAEEEANETMA